MVTIGWEQSVCFWDLESRKITDLIHAHEDRINAAAITPDGSVLATGGEDKTVILWEMATKDKKHILHHSDAVMSLAFTLDGGTLVTGMHHNIITNWDVHTGKQIDTLKIQE